MIKTHSIEAGARQAALWGAILSVVLSGAYASAQDPAAPKVQAKVATKAKAASADLGRLRRALLGDGAPPAPAPSIAPVGVSATSTMSARPGPGGREERS